MADGTSKTIGQVSVKVTPDTSKFRDEAKEKLAQIEARLPELKVKLTLDDKQLAAKVRAATDAAQRAARDIRIGFNIDGISAVRVAIEEAAAGAVAHIDVKVDPGSLARVKAELRALAGNVHVPVDIDKDNLGKLAKDVEKALSKIKVNADVDKGSEAKVVAEMQKLADEASASSRLHISVDETSVSDLKRSIRDALVQAAAENKLSIQLDTTRTIKQIQNLQKRLEEAFGPYRDKGLDAPIRATFDASSKESIVNAFKELENLRLQLGSKAKPIPIADEILSEIKKIPEDFTVTVTAEPNIRSVTAALKAIGSQWQTLKDQLEKDKVALGFTVEEAQLRAEIEKVKAEVAAQMHSEAIRLNFEYDKAAWKAQVEQAQAEAFARLNNIVADLKVNPDTASLNKALDELKALILKRNDITAKLDVETDGKTAAKLEAELAALHTKIGSFKVPVDPEINAISRTKFQVAMALLTRARNVEIDLNLKKGAIAALSVASVLSGFDALKESIEEAHKAFISLFTDLPELMVVVPAVLALAGGFLSAAGNVASLVGNLVQALPILLALPGIAIGITAMVLAFKDVNKVLPGVVTQFKSLQPLISNAFWAQAAAPIQNLANVVFPQLDTGLARTGGNLGVFFHALADNISKVLSGGALATWFDGLNASILVFTGFTPQLASIFQIFGNIGSALLVPLAMYVGELATRFNEWLTGLVNAAGGVQAFAQQTIDAFKGVIEFVISIGNVFGGVFSAAVAAGAASFQTLANDLNGFAALIKQPAFQQAITNLFSAAFQMMDNFLSKAGPALQTVFMTLSSVLTAILPEVGIALGQLATIVQGIFSDPKVAAGIEAFVGGILRGVESIIPVLAPLGTLVAALGPVLGQLAQQIGTVFAAVAPQIGELVTAIGPLISLFGTALVNALVAVMPLVNTVIQTIIAVLQQLTPALAPVMTAITTLIGALVGPLSSVITTLIPPLVQIVTAILPVISTILTALTPVLTTLVTAVLAILGPILTALAPILAQLAQMLGQVVVAAAPLLTTLAQLVGAILPPLMPLLVLLIDAAMVPLKLAIDALVPVLTILGDIFTFVVQQVIIPYVIPVIQLIIQLITAELIPVFQLIGDVFKAVWQLVMDVWNAFKALFSGDVSGFFDKMHQAWVDFGNRIWQAVKDAFSSIVSSTVSALVDWYNTVKDKVAAVQQFFADLPGKILGWMGNMGNVLIQAGKDLIQGFIDGIKSAFDKVKGLLGDLTKLLPDWKGPASTDKTLLFDAGQLVINGFLDGLESRYDAVRKSLQSFSSDIAGMNFSSPTVGVNASAFQGSESNTSGGNTFIYNAAPGSSLGSQEDLFTALDRGRAFGWG